jgi:hypothetical protein
MYKGRFSILGDEGCGIISSGFVEGILDLSWRKGINW